MFQACFASNEQVPLVMAGVFHALEPERRTVLWHVLARPSPLRPDVALRRFAPKPALLEAWDVLKDDYKYLRTSLGPHAIALVKRLAWPFVFPVANITLASELGPVQDGGVVTVVGLALVRQMPPTAKGMMFITLEDESGCINLVLQPQVSKAFRAEIVASDLLCVTARKQKNGVASTLLVTHVHATKTLQGGGGPAGGIDSASAVAPGMKAIIHLAPCRDVRHPDPIPYPL